MEGFLELSCSSQIIHGYKHFSQTKGEAATKEENFSNSGRSLLKFSLTEILIGATLNKQAELV